LRGTGAFDVEFEHFQKGKGMKANVKSAEEIDKPPRARLIEAATRLFCRQGINATGIDAVLREAGTAKMTLYKLFGSKERLVEAVLEEEGRKWRDWFLSGLDAGNESPRRKLDRIFPMLRKWFAEDEFYGCPFINAVGEHDKKDDRLRSLTIHHKKEVLQKFTSLAAAAGAANPETVAHQLGLLMDGAIVAVMVTRDLALADMAGSAATALLDQATARVPA
jgi:AcrR family transcriptional regulator